MAHEPQVSVSLIFCTTFLRLLWSITEQTHSNMESICFLQWSEKKKDRYTHLSRTAWLFEDLGKILGIFKVPKAIYCLRLDYQPLFGKMSPHSSPEEDQRPVPGDGGNRAYLSSLLLPLFLYFACVSFLETFFEQRLFMLKVECWWWRKHFATQRASRSDDTRWQLLKFLVV